MPLVPDSKTDPVLHLQSLSILWFGIPAIYLGLCGKLAWLECLRFTPRLNPQELSQTHEKQNLTPECIRPSWIVSWRNSAQ